MISLRQPAWHVVTLTALTCCAYPFYWFYKNWRDLSSAPQTGRFHNTSPLLRTIGLFVPIANIALAYSQIKAIAELHPNSQSLPKRNPRLAAVLVILSFTVLQLAALAKGPAYLLSFASAAPLAIAQSWLNSFWQSVEEDNRSVRYAFTIKEMIVLIVGSLWLGLILASFLIVPSHN